jgi:hypothetical protein
MKRVFEGMAWFREKIEWLEEGWTGKAINKVGMINGRIGVGRNARDGKWTD